ATVHRRRAFGAGDSRSCDLPGDFRAVAGAALACRRPGLARRHATGADGAEGTAAQTPSTTTRRAAAALPPARREGERAGGVVKRAPINTRGPRQKLKTARGRSTSSQLWLERQINDPYVKAAKAQGFRSRAAYKLLEMNEKHRFLKRGM